MRLTWVPTRRDQALIFWFMAIFLVPVFAWLYAFFLGIPLALAASFLPASASRPVLTGIRGLCWALSAGTVWALWRSWRSSRFAGGALPEGSE